MATHPHQALRPRCRVRQQGQRSSLPPNPASLRSLLLFWASSIAHPDQANRRSLEQDTIVGIIEVMKLMNTVRAGVRGEVVEVLATNGAPVEYGEILLRVRPAS